jgi:hypothetical protein
MPQYHIHTATITWPPWRLYALPFLYRDEYHGAVWLSLLAMAGNPRLENHVVRITIVAETEFTGNAHSAGRGQSHASCTFSVLRNSCRRSLICRECNTSEHSFNVEIMRDTAVITEIGLELAFCTVEGGFAEPNT